MEIRNVIDQDNRYLSSSEHTVEKIVPLHYSTYVIWIELSQTRVPFYSFLHATILCLQYWMKMNYALRQSSSLPNIAGTVKS
jgi:hypothetical protein